MEGGVPEADMSAFRECLSLSWKNPYVLRLAFSAGIGGLLFGYDTGNYSYIPSLYNPSHICVFPHLNFSAFKLQFIHVSNILTINIRKRVTIVDITEE